MDDEKKSEKQSEIFNDHASNSLQIEKSLMESESMFRSIVENSHAGIFTIDGSFHIIYANHRLAEILGFSNAAAWHAICTMR